MNLNAIASVPGAASSAVSNPVRALIRPSFVRPVVRPPEPAKVSPKIQQAARQFETQLLTSLLASLETSLGSVPGSEETGVSQQYHSLATQSLAGAWAAAGGIGIARILTRALIQAPKTAPLLVLPSSLPAVALPVDVRPASSSFFPKGR